MDYQVGIVAMHPSGSGAALARASSLLAAARQAGIVIIHVQVGFRPGYPEISRRNLAFDALSRSGRLIMGETDTAIHPTVVPQPGDLVVWKRRVSAFAGSDLEAILRAREVDTLILLGIATSGVVLSTVRHAADADYRMVVVADCCLDRDDEVHRCLVEKVFPRQATVVACDEALSALRPAR